MAPRGSTAIDLKRDGAALGSLETVSTGAAGSFEIADAWVSPSYGARERAPRCRFTARLAPGTTVLTSTIRLHGARPTAATAAQLALSEAR